MVTGCGCTFVSVIIIKKKNKGKKGDGWTLQLPPDP